MQYNKLKIIALIKSVNMISVAAILNFVTRISGYFIKDIFLPIIK